MGHTLDTSHGRLAHAVFRNIPARNPGVIGQDDAAFGFLAAFVLTNQGTWTKWLDGV